MQALKRYARETLILVTLDRPDWGEWWEGFKERNPVSGQITEEFWKRYRRKLNRLDRPRLAVRISQAALSLYENYYMKRVFELRGNAKQPSTCLYRKHLASG